MVYFNLFCIMGLESELLRGRFEITAYLGGFSYPEGISDSF